MEATSNKIKTGAPINIPHDLDDEIDMIQRADLRALIVRCLAAAPAEFWTAAAGTSSNRHPGYARASRGIIRHTRAVVRLTRHLLEDIGLTTNDNEWQTTVTAAILHDICLRDSGSRFTRPDHPLRAAELIETVGRDMVRDQSIKPPTVRVISSLVACHMGRHRGTRRYVDLPAPLTRCERILAQADYLASCRDIIVTGIDTPAGNNKQ